MLAFDQVVHFVHDAPEDEDAAQLRPELDYRVSFVYKNCVVALEQREGSLAHTASLCCLLQVQLSWHKDDLVSHAVRARDRIHAVVAVLEAITDCIMRGWRAPGQDLLPECSVTRSNLTALVTFIWLMPPQHRRAPLLTIELILHLLRVDTILAVLREVLKLNDV